MDEAYKDINVRDLLENWVDSVLIVDLKGKVLTINKTNEETFGYLKNEVAGKNAIELFVIKEDIPKSLGMLKDVLVSGKAVDKELRVKHKNGKLVDVSFSAAVLKNAAGVPNRILIVIRDVTEKKRLQMQVEQLNEELKIINKILRHDILNDLTVVAGEIDTYQQYGSSKMDLSELLSDMKTAMERGIGFIKSMKKLEEAITVGEELKDTNIEDVLNEVKKEHDDVDITLKGNATIKADHAFYSVLDNLFKNAKVHGGAENIKVNVEEDGPNVVIRVADDGKGIPAEAKKNLFTEGFKYGETGHTGLGLYIIKKTIERYGGEVSVEDNKPQGAVFVLKVPKR